MPSESLRLLRFEYQTSYDKACRIVREHAKRYGSTATVAKYGLDQYEYSCALQGARPSGWEFRVLETHEAVDKRDTM